MSHQRKTIMISAGGTATAWHLVSLIHERFSDSLYTIVADCNPAHLIPVSTIADSYIQVPLIKDSGYEEAMLTIFRDHDVEIFVPLIDQDVLAFGCDSPDLKILGVTSTGVTATTAEIMASKSSIGDYLSSQGIGVPHEIRSWSELAPHHEVFLKPAVGFASRGARVIDRDAAKPFIDNPEYVLQTLCIGPEITVEVFNSRGVVASLCRERIETKSGVCTKTKIFENRKLQQLSERLCQVINLPAAFCYQVMKSPDGEWVVIDLNPRLGAGTALCTRAGWSLASAALATWTGSSVDPLSFLQVPAGDTYVTRVYQEVLMNDRQL